MKNRCIWCGEDPLYIAYHDEQWGVPVHDDRLLFEFLVLEGAQAGLSWLTILKKRENYRKAFHAFDCETIAGYSETDVKRLLSDSGIVRNRLKIESAIRNARAVLRFRRRSAHWTPISGAMLKALLSKINGNSWQRFRRKPNCPK
jgi:DNA-3-methyladenine glycosylase I